MSQTIYQTVIDSVNTKVQEDSLLKQIDTLIDYLYKKEGSIEEKVSKVMSHEYKEKITSIAEKENIDLNEPVKFQKFLEDLKEEIRKVAIINLHLSLDPSDSLVQSIASWLAPNMGHKVIIDVIKEPSLIGGMSISNKGVYWEHSIRKKLLEKFKSKEFLKFLK